MSHTLPHPNSFMTSKLKLLKSKSFIDFKSHIKLVLWVKFSQYDNRIKNFLKNILSLEILCCYFRIKDSEGVDKQVESVCFFKDGIEPAWEDPVNAKGGDF